MTTKCKSFTNCKEIVGIALVVFYSAILGCADKTSKNQQTEARIAMSSTADISHESKHTHEHDNHTHKNSDLGERIMKPDAGQHFWIFPESKDKLGSGGKLQIFMDPESHPRASAGFAKYEMGVGGMLPEHKHDKTEEIAYFISGEGIVITYVNEKRQETPVKEGYVWYTPPGEWHSFKNTGKEPLKLVFANIPNAEKGLLSFFKKVGTEPGKESTTFSPEEFARIATEHDLILKPVKID